MTKLRLKEAPSHELFQEGLKSWRESDWKVVDIRAEQGTLAIDEKKQTLLIPDRSEVIFSVEKSGNLSEITAELEQGKNSCYGKIFGGLSFANYQSGSFLFANPLQAKIYDGNKELSIVDFKNGKCSCISFGAYDFLKENGKETRIDWGYSLIFIGNRSEYLFSTTGYNKKTGNLRLFLEQLKYTCKALIVMKTLILDPNKRPEGISRCDGKMVSKQKKTKKKDKIDCLLECLPNRADKILVKESESIQKNIFPGFYSKSSHNLSSLKNLSFKTLWGTGSALGSKQTSEKKNQEGGGQKPEKESFPILKTCIQSFYLNPTMYGSMLIEKVGCKLLEPFLNEFMRFIENKKISKWRLYSDVGIMVEGGVKLLSLGEGYLQFIARKEPGHQNHYYDFACKGLSFGTGISTTLNLTAFFPTSIASPIYLLDKELEDDFSGQPILVSIGKTEAGITTKGVSFLFLNVPNPDIKKLGSLSQIKLIQTLFLECRGVCLLQTNTFSPTTFCGTGISIYVGQLKSTRTEIEGAPRMNINSLEELITYSKTKALARKLKDLTIRMAKHKVYQSIQKVKSAFKLLLECTKAIVQNVEETENHQSSAIRRENGMIILPTSNRRYDQDRFGHKRMH